MKLNPLTILCQKKLVANPNCGPLHDCQIMRIGMHLHPIFSQVGHRLAPARRPHGCGAQHALHADETLHHQAHHRDHPHQVPHGVPGRRGERG